eukprot:gene10953-3661_t
MSTENMTKEKFDKKNYMIHFESIFINKIVHGSFRDFLKTEYNQQPLDFLMEIEKYKKLTKEKEQIKKIHEIVSIYLNEESKEEINISGKLKLELLDQYKPQIDEHEEFKMNPKDFFTHVQKVVQEELYFDSWKRFVRSNFCDGIVYKFHDNSAICSPQMINQFSYPDDYYSHPFIFDADIEFAKLLIKDNFHWELINRDKNGMGNTFWSTLNYFPNFSESVSGVKQECILKHSFDKVLLTFMSDKMMTDDIDPTLKQIKTVEYYDYESLKEIFKERGFENSISKYKRSQVVNHSDIVLGPLMTPRIVSFGITAHQDVETGSVFYFGKPYERENRKFFKSTKMNVVVKKGEEPKNTNAIPMFDWFFYYLQKIDENKTLYTQIHMFNIGGYLSKLKFDSFGKMLVKAQGEKVVKNLEKLMNKIPEDAKLSDFLDDFSKLDENGIPFDGSGRLLYDLNTMNNWSK